jgi:hypothetical protein
VYLVESELQAAFETKSLDDMRSRRSNAAAARESAAAALSLIETELSNAEAGLEGLMRLCS